MYIRLQLVLGLIKRSPIPKLGDLLPKVVPIFAVKSVVVIALIFMNLLSLLKENLDLAVEKLIASW